jgi:hypothetical protein
VSLVETAFAPLPLFAWLGNIFCQRSVIQLLALPL